MGRRNQGETECIRVTVTLERAAVVQDRAADFTRAEGRRRSPTEMGKNALVFYLRALARCPSCTACVECLVHGTATLRPEATAEPTEPVASVDDCRRVTDLYFSAFTAARGLRPGFGAREGKAVKDLVLAVGVDTACAAVTAAFQDEFWNGKATILSIASDPSKHIGTRATKPRPASSLQPDSGYEGGKEVR